ncbi:putative nuclease HARBI1 [Bombina bombina]|uniref:putative nuclease HARBI1 n=1 Tax=Bombina bombina TaxID=8345 RepID=UPI00235A5502|nr:putative nuclease HARBI1 [Bombina bombina]
MRFRCLDRSGGNLQYSPEKAITIIVSCCYLHNMAQEHGMLNDLLPPPQPPGEIFEPDVIYHPQPLNAHLERTELFKIYFQIEDCQLQILRNGIPLPFLSPHPYIYHIFPK